MGMAVPAGAVSGRCGAEGGGALYSMCLCQVEVCWPLAQPFGAPQSRTLLATAGVLCDPEDGGTPWSAEVVAFFSSHAAVPLPSRARPSSM